MREEDKIIQVTIGQLRRALCGLEAKDAASGIVVPAWKILETIHQEELMEVRRQAEKVEKRRVASVPGMDSARPKKADANLTQADFEAVLRKASRKIAPDKN